MNSWTWGAPSIAFGGDYNPEQWPRQTWDEDVALMTEAGVNLVSIGIFSWAMLEPREGEFDFEWLDDVIGRLHAAGIAVDLATPTASPPAWFFAQYPEARVVRADGVPLGFGSRGAASPSSQAYRAASVRIATELATRYGDHPAVVMWHVHNEYGAPVGEDYSSAAVGAFRAWLRRRYGSLDALNAAWGTAFWGQTYCEWEHVGAPGPTPSVMNPAQKLDFIRFTDHQLRECYIVERDAIRAHSDRPITTNFMANEYADTDLWQWAREVDVVSNDHYLTAADPDGHIGLALAADLTRSVAGGKPWILMEHSTSAVNWQPRNVAKRAGEMARNSLSHFARGADGILFFQWRASRSGAEKFHSAMLPHAGTSSRVWREVVELGAAAERLGEVSGSRVIADVAILWDWESFWAQDLDWRPSVDVQHRERMRAFYERLWLDGLTVDFVHPESDLSRYRLVVAPASYLLSNAAAANVRGYVEDGGVLLMSFFSAIVDENDAVHVGGYAAPLRDVLGLTVEEFRPLRQGVQTSVVWEGGARSPRGTLPACIWQEDIALEGAQVIARYADGAAQGGPAVTRHDFGRGTAWYVATVLDAAALAPLLDEAYGDAGLTAPRHPHGVEAVTRVGEHEWVTVINHGSEAAEVATGSGVELISGQAVDGVWTAPAGAVGVVRRAAAGRPDASR